MFQQPPSDKDASVDLSDVSVRPEPDAGTQEDAGPDASGPLPPWTAYTGAMTTDGAMLWSGVSRTWAPTPAPTELVTRGTMCTTVDREGRALFFGGHNSGGTAKSGSDFFRFDGSRWDVLRASVGFPPGRSGAGCFVHPTTGAFYVFGGVTYDGANPAVQLADTWKWDGTGTTWVSLGASPWGSSTSPAYAVDLKRNLLVLRGGGAPGGRHKATYDWNGANWVLWPSNDDYVSNLAMAYHAKREQVVRLGGLNPGNTFTDSCQLSNPASNGWTACTGTIPARYNHAMAYDPAAQNIVVFGGILNGGLPTQETWTWDGTWTNGSGGIAPPAKHAASLVYVASIQKMLLVGGFQ